MRGRSNLSLGLWQKVEYGDENVVNLKLRISNKQSQARVLRPNCKI
jgi:hypothetical protein